MKIDPKARYGQWAIVAGASEGLGAAFAHSLASRGHDLLLLARRENVLMAVADEIRKKWDVAVRTITCDLAVPDFVDALHRETQGLEIGVAVYNAAYSYVGSFLSRPLDEALRVVDVNVRGPLQFVHALAPGMIERRRGSIVLMSSLAGLQGSPKLAAYAASKAFNIILGESLWAELKPHGIDVVVSCAGAIRTPGYLRTAKGDAPGTLEPEAVAESTLAALGKGPVVVPGGVNKLAAFMMRRLFPRTTAVSIMGKSTADLA